MNINRYMLLSAVLTFAATANAELTYVQEKFKKALTYHLESIDEHAREIKCWESELLPETKSIKYDARMNVLINVNEAIETRKKRLRDFGALQKARMPWLKNNPLLNTKTITQRDPILRGLKFTKDLVNKDQNSAHIQEQLIKTFYLPNAQFRHAVYKGKLPRFDLHWIKKEHKYPSSPKIDGFEKLYAARKDDFDALKKGYLLNPRTLEEQRDLIETSRGIDPISKITIDGYDMSVAYYEQNNFGTPDKAFNAQEIFKVK